MKPAKQQLRIAIPKGSLQEATLRVFREAGFDIKVPERKYILEIDDPDIECFMMRPQEIPKYVERGKLDLGIAGSDWILETSADVVEVCDLRYAKQKIKKVKWVLAVPRGSGIKSLRDLKGKTISTEIVNYTRQYLKKNNVRANVVFSWGATEVKPPLFADAAVDLTETGASIRAHNLKILRVVLESSTQLIANKTAWADSWKRQKIADMALLLESTVKSEQMTNLMMHISSDRLKMILGMLGRFKPSARRLAKEPLYNVSVACGLPDARILIPKLKRAGCEGIVQSPIAKLLP